MNREELLKGLGTIRDLIAKINQLADKQVRIESQVRQTISTSGAKRKSQMIVASLGIVILAMDIILCLLHGKTVTLVSYAICALILWRKRGQKSLLKTIILGYVELCFIVEIITLLDTGIFVLLIPFFVLYGR